MLAAERFGRLLAELAPTDADRGAAMKALRAVRATLRTQYYGSLSLQDHTRVVGAWAKGTEIRPPRPIDVFFTLPKNLRQAGPRAAADAGQPRDLVDAARHTLEMAHDAARITPSGRAVIVSAGATEVAVQLVFPEPGGRFLVCVCRGEGRFASADPTLEEARLSQVDAQSKGNARDLIRMMRCWQGFRDVAISSFALELLAIEFLGAWPRAGEPVHFYDWMIRDFFAFLVAQANRTLEVPGSTETLALGADWLGAASVAQTHAAKACEFESQDLNADAWWEWEKLFGERVPLDER